MSHLDVKILSLEWKNIRSFDHLSIPIKQGEISTNLPQSGGIYLQMPNGTGKTTTLNLLRASFTGIVPENADDWRRLLQLEDAENFINAPSEFVVRLMINGQSYGVHLKLDHESGNHLFFTSTPTGRQQGWHPPSEFKRAFQNNSSLVDLFIFDAESARDMINKTDRKLIKQAIREFGGFSQIYDLIGESTRSGTFAGGRLGTIKDDVSTQIGTLGETGGGRQRNWTKALAKAQTVRRELEIEITESESELTQIRNNLSVTRLRLNQIDADHGRNFERVAPLQSSISGIKTMRKTNSELLLKLMLDPACTFDKNWSEIRDFHSRHQDANLPADVGRGWLLKLAEEDSCICGTPFNPEMRLHIRENGEEHLDRQKMVSVSEMQSEFKDTITASRDSILSTKHDLLVISGELGTKETELEILLGSAASAEIIAEKDNLKDYERGLVIAENDLEFLLKIRTTNNMEFLRGEGRESGLNQTGAPTESLATIQVVENINILERITDNLTQLLLESQEQGEIWKGLQKVRAVLGNAVNQLSTELRTEISDTATKIWRSMPAAGAEGALRLEIKDNGMAFQRGRTEATAVSGAQSVSACYSIAQAITKLGQISIPLICDTPFAGFDFGMLPSWQKSISESFDQYMVLMNTAERATLGELCYDDFCGSMRQLPGLADDGGRKFEFTTDMNVFKSLIGPNDTNGVVE